MLWRRWLLPQCLLGPMWTCEVHRLGKIALSVSSASVSASATYSVFWWLPEENYRWPGSGEGRNSPESGEVHLFLRLGSPRNRCLELAFNSLCEKRKEKEGTVSYLLLSILERTLIETRKRLLKCPSPPCPFLPMIEKALVEMSGLSSSPAANLWGLFSLSAKRGVKGVNVWKVPLNSRVLCERQLILLQVGNNLDPGGNPALWFCGIKILELSPDHDPIFLGPQERKVRVTFRSHVGLDFPVSCGRLPWASPFSCSCLFTCFSLASGPPWLVTRDTCYCSLTAWEDNFLAHLCSCSSL